MARAADGPRGVTFLDPTGDTSGDDHVGWAEMYTDARRLAGFLQAQGVYPGRSVVVLAVTSRPAVTAIMAIWLAGGTLTVAPTPARTMDEAAYTAETHRRINHLGNDPLVLVGTPFERVAASLADRGLRVLHLPADVTPATSPEWHPVKLGDDDPAILQLTSGTTSSAKTVRITHRNLAVNVEAIRDVSGHQGHHYRKILSWLPLSHDMGLIGTLVMPLACGSCDLLLYSPIDHVAAPSRWMRLASQHRATGLAGPTSAYALAARLLETGPRLDLSAVKGAVCGGEPIDPGVLTGWLDAGARHGLDPNVLMPAFGLAEGVVAVTMTPLGRGHVADAVDADLLDQRRHAVPADPTTTNRVRMLMRLGPPVPGTQVRIADTETGAALTERMVGEIHISGASVATSYHRDPDGSARARTPDGWFRTGDLGYLVEGELVVTGRAKDVIILAGRNIYPEDVERAAAKADGVRPGNAVAFAYQRPGGLIPEGVAIAVETRWEDHDVVRKSVADHVQAALGIIPHMIAVLAPGTIPKTPSGKLQRTEARRMFGPA
jgi:fatty-acyl-CoA synthase